MTVATYERWSTHIRFEYQNMFSYTLQNTYLSLSTGMTTLANFPKPVVTPYTTEKTGKRIFKVSHKEIIKNNNNINKNKKSFAQSSLRMLNKFEKRQFSRPHP